MKDLFFEINITTPNEDKSFMLNKVFTRIHGALKTHNLNIGLSFPEISEPIFENEKKPLNMGSTIRAFGTKKSLEILHQNTGLAHLSKTKGILLSEIQELPLLHYRVSYIRTRENYFSYLKKNKKASKFPYIIVEKKDNKIPIFIRKVEEEDFLEFENMNFNSYGLGNGNSNKFSSVYNF